MKVIVRKSSISGSVAAPASKSFMHRALICAALSQRPTEIFPADCGDDVLCTMACLEKLGVSFTVSGGKIIVSPPKEFNACARLDCGQSGSTLRFLLPLACALGLNAEFCGSGRLPERPIGELLSALEENGAAFTGHRLPLTVSGAIRSGCYKISGNVSSQFATGLLMALPLLSGDSEIVFTTPLASAAYVDVTTQVMKAFSVHAEKSERGYFIPGGQTYKSPGQYKAEGDWSAAAFLLFAAALGGDCRVSNLNPLSKQSDTAALKLLEGMGVSVKSSDGGVSLAAAKLSPIEVDVSDFPDLVPPLAALAAYADGDSRLYNAGKLRFKESDRLAAVEDMINSMGGRAKVINDSLVIKGGGLSGGFVDPKGDHRIAMAAVIAALRCEGETQIADAQCVSKSYPSFFEDLKKLGADIEFID